MSAKELQETLISFKESLSNSSEVGRNEEEKRLISPEYRQDALELELQQVQNVNKVIENAITSLDQAGNNVDMVLETAKNTDELLDIWIKILSQSSHISNLLMNTENWFGATKDDELYEDRLREIQRQQEQERLLQEQRAREEEERRQKQEEIERRRKQKEDLLRSRGKLVYFFQTFLFFYFSVLLTFYCY